MMKALTRFRRLLSIALTIAIVFNTVDASTLSAEAVSVSERDLTADGESGAAEDTAADESGGTIDPSGGGESSEETPYEQESEDPSGEQGGTETSGDAQTGEDGGMDEPGGDGAAENEDAGEAGETDGAQTPEDGETAADGQTPDGEEASGETTLSKSVAGRTIAVSGAFPEGTALTAGAVGNTADIQAMIESEATGSTVVVYDAFDISLENDGEAWQPVAHGERVTVTMEGLSLDEEHEQDTYVFHVLENEDGDLSLQPVDAEVNASAGTVTFEADSFSPYVVAGVYAEAMTLAEGEIEINLGDPGLSSIEGQYTVGDNYEIKLDQNGQKYRIYKEKTGSGVEQPYHLVISGNGNQITIDNTEFTVSSNAAITVSGTDNEIFFNEVTTTATVRRTSLDIQTSVNISVGETGTSTLPGIINIKEGAVLSVSGTGTLLLTNNTINGSGTLNVNGAQIRAEIANFPKSIKLQYGDNGGSFYAVYEEEDATFFDAVAFGENVGLLVGTMGAYYQGDLTLTFSPLSGFPEIEMGRTFRAFAALLQAGSYGINSTVEQSAAQIVGREENGDTQVSNFMVTAGQITKYVGLKRIQEPTFWRAHFSSLTSDETEKYTVTLDAEVDREGVDSLFVGSETIIERGFYILERYKINVVDYAGDGSLDYKLSESGSVSIGDTVLTPDTTFDKRNQKIISTDGNATYSVEIGGLEEGYIYVATPYVRTAMGRYYANRRNTFLSSDTDTVYHTLSDTDPVTGTNNASVAIVIPEKTWPDTMTMTYGDQIKNITVGGQNASLGDDIVYQANGTPLTAPVSILHDKQLKGTFSFEVYRDKNDDTTKIDNLANVYLDAGTYYVEMTFTPDETDPYSKSFQPTTSDWITLKVDPMQVSVEENGDALFRKTYDNTAIFTEKDFVKDRLVLIGYDQDGNEDRGRNELLAKWLNDNKIQVSATATAESKAANADKDGTPLTGKAAYTTTINTLSIFQDADTAAPSGNFVYIAGSSKVTALIKQKPITATLQIQKQTGLNGSEPVFAEESNNQTVETGQYYKITAIFGENDLVRGDGASAATILANSKYTIGSASSKELSFGETSYETEVAADGLTIAAVGDPVSADSNYVLDEVNSATLKVTQHTPIESDYELSGTKDNGTDFWKTNVTVSPKNANTSYDQIRVGTSNNIVTDGIGFLGSVVLDENGIHTYYIQMRDNKTGAFTSVEEIKVKIDTGEPVIADVEITQGQNTLAAIFNKVSFGLFFKEKVTITVTAKTPGESKLGNLVYTVTGTKNETTQVSFVNADTKDADDNYIGTASFDIGVNQLTKNDKISFHVTSGAGVPTEEYEIKLADGTDLKNPDYTFELGTGTVIVVEDTAPQVKVDVSGTAEKLVDPENANEGKWYTGDAVTLTATITDPDATDETAPSTKVSNSGIAYYEVTKTTHTSATDAVGKRGETKEYRIDQDSAMEFAEELIAETTYEDTLNSDVYKIVYEITAYDNAGNESGLVTKTIHYDKTAPELSGTVTKTGVGKTDTFTLGKTENPDVWTNQPVTVDLTVSDTTSGVASLTVSKGDAAATSINVTGGTASYSIEANGTYTFTLTDNAGNTTTKEVTVSTYDKEAPVLTGVSYTDGSGSTIDANQKPYGTTDAWSKDQINVTVTFTDTESGDGVSGASGFGGLSYTYDGASGWISVSASDLTVSGDTYTFAITKSGTYENFKVTATDKAGNVSDPTDSATLNIDNGNLVLDVTATKGDALYNGTTMWAKNGETIVYKLEETSGSSASKLTYQIQEGADGTYKDISEWANAHGSVADWNGTAHTLTFHGSYQGTIKFRVMSESGTRSNEESREVKISTETLNASDNITLTPENPQKNPWYSAEGLTVTITGEKSAENTSADANPTPDNHVTTEYEISYKAKESETYQLLDAYKGDFIYDSEKFSFMNSAGREVISFGSTAASGYYQVTVTATDVAGNTSTAKKTFQLDTQAPTLGEVTYLNTPNSSIEQLLNKLTFGIFFKESVAVGIEVEDDMSGVNEVRYQIVEEGDTFDASNYETATIDRDNDTATFTLKLDNTNGYIKYWAVDNAGNETAKYNLGYDTSTDENKEEKGEILWLLENTPPTAEDFNVTVDPDKVGNAVSGVSDAANWYKGEVTLQSTITDTDGAGKAGSGLSEVTVSADRKATLNDTEKSSYNLEGKLTDLNGNNEVALANERINEALYTATLNEDGIYEITLNASDNAGNAMTTPVKKTIYLDQKPPVVSHKGVDGFVKDVSYVISITVQDTTSGLASLVVTTDDGQLSSNGSGSQTQDITVEKGLVTEHTYSFTVYGNGTYMVNATDCAGNVTPYKIEVKNFDRKDPTLGALIAKGDLKNPNEGYDQNSNYYTSETISISAAISDDTDAANLYASGVNAYQVEYEQDSQGAQREILVSKEEGRLEGTDTEISFLFDKSGVYTFYVTLWDAAGNETIQEATYRLENGKPAFSRTAWTKTKGDDTSDYDAGTWTNADKVELTLASGADEDGNAIYSIAVDPKVSGGVPTEATTWTPIGQLDTSLGTVVPVGEISASGGGNGGNEGIKLIVEAEGSHTYYFKVQHATSLHEAVSAPYTIKIDRTPPDAATYEIEGTNNAPADEPWYRAITSLTLTDNDAREEDVEKAPNTIKYYVTSEETVGEKTPPVDVDVSEVPGQGSTNDPTAHPPINEDGVWYLHYWTVDEAGNESVEQTETIRLDSRAPQISHIEVTATGDNPVLKALTFGIFGNSQYKVTATLKDIVNSSNGLDTEISGIGALTYKVTDRSGEVKDRGTATTLTYYTDADYTTKSKDNARTAYAVAEFTISEQFTDGTIELTVADYAGNTKTEKASRQVDNTNVTVWTYTTATPQITLEPTPDANAVGWYKDDVTVDVTATEVNAGLESVSYALTGANGTEGDILTADKTASEDKKREETSGNITITGAADGTTTVTVNAVSNAGNPNSASVELNIDKTEPEFNQVYQSLDADGTNWHNEEQDVTFTLTDQTSGVREDTIEVYKVDSAESTNTTTNPIHVSITPSEGAEDRTVDTVNANTAYTVTIPGVSENGYYYIVAEDMAGNQVTGHITVDNIDMKAPASPTFTVTQGTSGDNDWYKESSITVQISVNTQSDRNRAEDTLYYQVLELNNGVTGDVVLKGSKEAEDGKTTITVDLTIPDGTIPDGSYRILAWTKNAAGSYDGNTEASGSDPGTIKTSNQKDVKVDTTSPEIGGTFTENPESWTPYDKTITFTVTDPQGTGVNQVSGVTAGLITVTFTPADGSERSTRPVTATGTANQYQFIAEANGTYTVNATDAAGNAAVQKEYRVSTIDKTDTAELNPIVQVNGRTVNENDWYAGTEAWTLSIQNPTAGAGESAVTTYYKLWNTSGTNASEPDIYETTSGIATHILTNGVWNLEIYAENNAGTKTDIRTYTIHVDQTAPTVDYTKIQVTDQKGSLLKTIANFFGFGNYFQSADGITISLSGTDQAGNISEYSDIAEAYYQLSEGGDVKEAKVDSDGKDGFTIEFDLSADDLSSERTITVWTVDKAGNKSDETKLGMTRVEDGNDPDSTKTSYSSLWMIDTKEPEISTPVYKLSDNSAAPLKDDYYNTGLPTMTVEVGDSQGSGLYKLESTITATDTDGNVNTETGLETYSTKDTDTKTERDTYKYTFPKDGTYAFKLKVTDNANNVETKDWTVKVDATEPTGTFKVAPEGTAEGSAEGLTEDYFKLSGGAWLNKAQTVYFTLNDNFSGLNPTDVKLTAEYKDSTGAHTIAGTKLTVIEATAAKELTGSFVVGENGTYTLTWSDVAGNEVSETIEVTNVDVTGTEKPEVTVTPAGDGSPADNGNWYTGSTPTIAITPNFTDKANASPETTKYIWRNTSLENASEPKAAIYATKDGEVEDEGTAPAVNGTGEWGSDGIWELQVWNEDAAGHSADSDLAPRPAQGESAYKLYVDQHEPTAGAKGNAPEDGSATANDVTLTFTLNDGPGSGVDLESLELTHKEIESSSTITELTAGIEKELNTDGTVTVTYIIKSGAAQTNGDYELSYVDKAGNKGTARIRVTQMDANQVPDAVVFYADSKDATGGEKPSGDVTDPTMLNVASVYLNLKAPGYSGVATLTYSATLTAPDTITTTNYNDLQIRTGVWTGDLSTQEGLWTLHTTTDTNADGQKATQRDYYILIDHQKPMVTATKDSVTAGSPEGVNGIPEDWTNADANISFYVTDPTNVAKDQTVSGVKSVMVSTTDGSIKGTTAGTPMTLTPTADGEYSFTAELNGKYTITATDHAGNVKAYPFEIKFIEKERPAQIENIEVIGTKGSPSEEATDKHWFKKDESTSASTKVRITLPDSTGKAPYTIYYVYWADGTTAPTEHQYTDTDVYKTGNLPSGKLGETREFELPEGKWNIAVWTKDSAGNEQSSRYTLQVPLKVHNDLTSPVVENAGIGIEAVGDSIFEEIGNRLTFGNFFKEGIRITVPVTDASAATTAVSGPKTLYYAVTETADTSPAKENYKTAKAEAGGKFSFTFGPEQENTLLDGYIWVYAEDAAGNTSEPVKLKAHKDGGSEYWLIDLVDPTVTLTLTNADGTGHSGWFYRDDLDKGNYPVVLAVIREGFDEESSQVSGLNSIRWELQRSSDGGETYEKLTGDGTSGTVYKDPTDIEEGYQFDRLSLENYMTADGSADGYYRVVYTVKDNAGRTATASVDVQIDVTAPVIAELVAPANTDPTNQPQQVKINASDVTSGIASILIETKDGSISTTPEREGVQSVTLTGDELEEMAFYACTNGTYTVTVTDAAGNVSESKEITINNIDVTAPKVTETTPGNLTEKVDYNETTITITFDEEVKPQEGKEITVLADGTKEYTYKLTGNETVTKDDSVNPTVWKVTLELTEFTNAEGDSLTYEETYTDENGKEQTAVALDADTAFTVTLPEGAFADVAGNGMEGHSFSFKTKEADTENDPWLKPNTLTSLELTGYRPVTSDDPDDNFDRVNVVVSPEYDPETDHYMVHLTIDYLHDYGDGVYTLAEDSNLIVLLPENEVDPFHVKVELTDLYETDSVEISERKEFTYEDGRILTGFVITQTDIGKIDSGADDGFYYVRVTTDNHGSKVRYRYLLSIGGVKENVTLAKSADGSTTGVSLTPGTMAKALAGTAYEYIEKGSRVALQFIASVPKENTIVTARSVIANYIRSKAPRWANRTMYYYEFDVNMIVGEKVIPIPRTDADKGEDGIERYRDIEITITLPKELQGLPAYGVFYCHEEGGVTGNLLGASDDGTGKVVLNNDGTLTIRASEFSVYAVTGKVIDSGTQDGGSGSGSGGKNTETVYVNHLVTETVYVPSQTRTVVRTVTAGGQDTYPSTDDETTDIQTRGVPEPGEETEDEKQPVSGDVSGIPVGLALANLVFLVASMMTAEYSTLKQKRRKKIPNDLLCIGALALFFATQPLHGLIGRYDRYTPLFAAIFAVQLLITLVGFKKNAEEQEPQAEER